MKKLEVKKSDNVQTNDVLSGFELWRSRHLLKISWKSPKCIVGTMTFLLVIGGAIVYFSGTVSAAYLVVNGQKIGMVASVDKGQQIVDDILTKRGQSLGKVAKTHDRLEYEAVRVKKVELIGLMPSDKELQNVLNAYIDGYTLEIAGTQVAILPTQGDVDTLLKTYQDSYTKPNDTNKVHFC